MKRHLFQGGTAALMMVTALSAGAQTLDAVEGRVAPSAPKAQTVLPATVRTQAIGEVLNAETVKLARPQKMGAAALKGASRMEVREAGKPGAYYEVSEGFYTLVPGFPLRQISSSEYLYANHGILGYIDRHVTFYNRTEGADSFSWTFLNQDDLVGDSITTRPLFVDAGYVETPVLTAVAGTQDSTYQLGAYVDTEGKHQPGMMALSGSAYMWNGDVDAEPFLNTGFVAVDGENPWARVLFGTDVTERSAYMEMFEAPAGGPVALMATDFYVLTPSTVDLSQDRFSVLWAESQDGEYKSVKELTQLVPSLAQILTVNNERMRLWQVTAASDAPVLVDSAFYVMIQGPQDGTNWALLAQADRADHRDSTRNTAYYVPTVGENAGIPLQYVFEGYNAEGEVVATIPYCSSLDIHQMVVTPYILIAEGEQQTVLSTDSLNLDINGQSRKIYLSDWYNTASSGEVTITATVSQSTDGDWLTVTQPGEATGGVSLDYFEFTIQTSSLPFSLDGRRATVTLSDNLGFSRQIVIYQGDPEAADTALGVEEVKAAGQAKVVASDNGYTVTYPAGCSGLEVYSLSGSLMDVHELSAAGGTVYVPAASWQKGMYLFRLKGEAAQTVKVLK